MERDFSMHINNFEEYIDATILSRGLDYYDSGNVVSVKFAGGQWVAVVEGGDDYNVTVKMSNDGEVTDTYCDCPYDLGEYCKHQAAVLFAIKAKLSSKENLPAKNEKSLETTLSRLDRQELLSIILDMADKDDQIKDELTFKFAEKKDTLKSAREYIKNTINSAKRRGYVEYGGAAKAVEGADAVLEMIGDKINAGDYIGAVSLCVVVLEEMMGLLDICDDSDGTVGSVIEDAIEKINFAAGFMKPLSKNGDAAFKTIYGHAMNHIYDGWTEWRADLLAAAVPFCKNPANRSIIDKYIDGCISVLVNEPYKEFEINHLQMMRYDIISRFDGRPAADAYLEQHLDNGDFRRIAVQNAITGKRYEKALELCLAGEEKDKDATGLFKEWKQYRYAVYEKTKDLTNQQTLARELTLLGDFEYFKKLKPLVKDDEWPSVLDDIVIKLENNNRYNIYTQILVHENLKLKLLEYCRKNTGSIVSFYQNLLPDYKNETGAMFEKLIYENAARANARKSYRDVCGTIKLYKKTCGGAAAHAVRDKLAESYKRRPAFVDELRAIK